MYHARSNQEIPLTFTVSDCCCVTAILKAPLNAFALPIDITIIYHSTTYRQHIPAAKHIKVSERTLKQNRKSLTWVF